MAPQSYIILYCTLLVANGVIANQLGSFSYKRGGDFVVGAMLALREFDESTKECAPVTDLGAVRRAEAVAFAVDRINNSTDILGNISLGFEIYDTCYDQSVALGNALEFTERFRDRDNVIGIVGTSLSSTSSVTSLLMSNFNMTMVSHFATSDDLSNNDRYPFFMRIIAPDSYQVNSNVTPPATCGVTFHWFINQMPSTHHPNWIILGQVNAIIDILLHYQWEYVAFVYTESIYGRRAYDIFREKIQQTSICIPYSRGLTVTDRQPVYEDTLDDLQELRSQSLLSVVILFAEFGNIYTLMQTAFERNATRQFIWIGSDSFGIPCLSSIKGIEEAALGALTMIPKAGIVEHFEEYFQREKNKEDHDNPWMQEYKDGATEGDGCPAFESIIMDAVGVLARGMDELLEEKCGRPINDSCKGHVLGENRVLLHQILLNVAFNSTSNGPIFLLERGDTLGRYDIRHLNHTDSGGYHFQTVGNWTAGDGLRMERSVRWDITDDSSSSSRYSCDGIPKSLCADPCSTGQRRISSEDMQCCWLCEDCDEDELVINGTCGRSCIDEDRDVYQWPRGDRLTCINLEEQVCSGTPASVVIICLGTCGMVLTLAATAMYYQRREERLIKASSRELSYIIAVGVFFTYFGAVIFVTKANAGTCALRRTIPHVATTLIYVSIGTITVRLYRIFEAGRKSIKRPKFIHPKSQIMITLSLSLVPLIWAIIWLCVQPPTIVTEVTADGNRRLLVRQCSTSLAHRIGQLVWDIAVVLLCCYFAFRARNLPANYNQSRFIAFSVFSTLVVYVAFVPALAARGSAMQDLYSALGLIIQATVVLFLVIIVRLYAVMYADLPADSSKDNTGRTPAQTGSSHHDRDDSGKPTSSIKSSELL